MKESFVLYTNYSEQLELLSYEQRGILFTAIIAFESDKDLPEMDGITEMAFSFISSRMRVDDQKYEETCEKRREAGKKGGRPEKQKNQMVSDENQNNQMVFGENQKNQMVSTETKANQTKAKKPDSDSDSDNDNDSLKRKTNKREAPLEVCQEIVTTLNAATGCNYKASSSKTRSLITARLNEGYTVADFKVVIAKKADEWMGTEREKYLRPETLFGTKFEGYLNQHNVEGTVFTPPPKERPIPHLNKFNDFDQRDYDYDELEHRLIEIQMGTPKFVAGG